MGGRCPHWLMEVNNSRLRRYQLPGLAGAGAGHPACMAWPIDLNDFIRARSF